MIDTHSWLPNKGVEIHEAMPTALRRRTADEVEAESDLVTAMNLMCDDLKDAVVECWCGEKGPISDLFDESGLDQTCGGLGVLTCRCGGDQCVCHHHGEIECPGCGECSDSEDGDEP